MLLLATAKSVICTILICLMTNNYSFAKLSVHLHYASLASRTSLVLSFLFLADAETKCL